MIKISSKDRFIEKSFQDLFEQKKLFIIDYDLEEYFHNFEISISDNEIHFLINKKNKLNWKIPTTFNKIFKKIYYNLSNNFIYISDMKYYPLKNTVESGSKKLQLSEIQNSILLMLSLNLKNGIHKENLAKIIWPKDKEISINKLDTHLTNLKNQLAKDLNFKFNFVSKSSLLKLIIN